MDIVAQYRAIKNETKGIGMIKETPWIESPETKIWRAAFDAGKSPGCLGCWIIYAPWVNSSSNYYAASLAHLRPLDGNPASMQFNAATHELIIRRGDPRQEPKGLNAYEFAYLMPYQIVQQFTQRNDVRALELVESALSHVVAEQVSLTSKNRPLWHHLLRDDHSYVAQIAKERREQ